MANTYFDYEADADKISNGFPIPFEYLEDEHVTAEVDGVVNSDTELTTTTPVKIKVLSGVTVGQIVRVRRKSQPDTNLVDFVNGSVLTESELDRAYQHNRFLNEEISELNDASLQKKEGTGDFSAKNNKLVDLADPTAAQDAATKNYVDTRSLNDFDGTLVTSGVDLNGQRLTNISSPTTNTDAASKIYVDGAISAGISGTGTPPDFDTFTGDGTTTDFSLDFTTNSAASTAYLVTIDGVVIDPDAYTIVGAVDEIRFTTPPANLSNITVVERGFKVATDVPDVYDYGDVTDPATAFYAYGGLV
jgi:hypothetical protein